MKRVALAVLLLAAVGVAACGNDEPAPPAVEVLEWAHVAPEQITEAKKHGVPVAFENELGMRFVLIPAGTFWMGSPESEGPERGGDETRHRVTLSRPFYVQVTEVTNEHFRCWRRGHDSGEFSQPLRRCVRRLRLRRGLPARLPAARAEGRHVARRRARTPPERRGRPVLRWPVRAAVPGSPEASSRELPSRGPVQAGRENAMARVLRLLLLSTLLVGGCGEVNASRTETSALEAAVSIALTAFDGARKDQGPYRLIGAEQVVAKGHWVWRVTFKAERHLPADPQREPLTAGGEIFVNVDLSTRHATVTYGE